MDNAANSVVKALIDVGNIDTVYRDLYLDRARALLAPVLSPEDFHRLEQQRAAIAELPASIAHAIETANWPLVKELSLRAEALKRAIDDRAAALQVARSVYDVRDIRLDPFSPGLQSFTRIPSRELPTLRPRALELLGSLERGDVGWRDFYAARRRAFQARQQTAPEISQPDAATSSPADALEAARQALKAGDLKRLAALADGLSDAERRAGSSPAHAPSAASAPAESEPTQQLQPVAHSSETLARARHLGLAPRHLEPRTELASLRQYAWTPLSDVRGDGGLARLRLPTGAPEGLRNGLAIFLIHPLVNSGGARYLPSLLAEDVLVEDFPDPVEGRPATVSELVKRLGLSSRRGVPRIAIEQALLVHGPRILENELGLDPHVFRLVCIPPDIYVRLGEAEGWGREPFWTHFDGYLIRTVEGQVRLQALAGGDVRYGGLYDLLAVGREYDSDQLLARFAVVQRARMVAW